MNYMGRLLSNFKGFYNEINSATLTGAIDILVIQREDGSYATSPWHVRFGKMGVLRSKEKIVDVEVNGEPADIHMKLGDAGEAFFVQQAETMLELPAYLATSPIPLSHLELMEAGLQELKRAVKEDEEKLCAEQDDVTPTNHPRSNTLTQDDMNRGLEELAAVTEAAAVVAAVGAAVPGPEGAESVALASCRSLLYQSVNNSVEIPEPEVEEEGDAAVAAAAAAVTAEAAAAAADAALEEAGRVTEETAAAAAVEEAGRVTEETATQTEMSGREAETKACNPAITTSQIRTGKHVHKSNSTNNIECLSSSSTAATLPNPETASRERQRQRRKKRADFLKQRVSSKSESSAASDPMMREQHEDDEEDENIFDMEMSDEEEDEDDDEEAQIAAAAVLNNVSRRTVSMPIIETTKKAMTEHWAHTQFASSCHPFSDGDLTPIVSPIGSRPPSPKSDTELEHQKQEATSQTALTGDDMAVLDDVRWEWGELPQSTSKSDSLGAASLEPKSDDSGKPSGGLFKFMRNTKKIRHNPEQGGIYLDDLNLEDLDPELASLYLYHPSKHGPTSPRRGSSKDEDNESGRGASLPQSPVTIGKDDAHTDDLFAPMPSKSSSPDIGLSLCGGLEEQEGGDIPTDKFMQYLVTYDQFCEKPDLLTDPNLVIRIADKYYNWQVAGPIIMSVLAFQRPLPDSATDSLVRQYIPKKQRRRGWLWWGRTAVEPGPAEETTRSTQAPSTAGSAASSTPSSPRKLKEHRRGSKGARVSGKLDEELSTGDESDTSELSNKVCSLDDTTQTENKFKKSLKLSSDELARLKLREGVNEVAFSVTTQYQGTSRCTANIYLWNWDDRIIVSDIDGTITKSDVLGQVLPMIGKDWSQVGIANLYNLVANNGYRFIYLSARAIGQSKITRDYLRSIRQGELGLPDGPLMLSPSSLISAFHKEVIERKPEEFKISCLRDIIALFPSTRNPLYAGFGNKINDVWAYRAVGIPITRIFTVNHRGELKSEMISNFISSYSKLSDVADHFFPPLVEESTDQGKIHSGNFPNPSEFSTFTYWREPLPDIELDVTNLLPDSAKKKEKKEVKSK